ncbi:MAG: TFIIB-type zinc ribbon-containing protein [Bdellovibrionales bacterium]
MYWHDFIFTGRWSCRVCNGTFAREADLRQVPVFHDFVELLAESPAGDKLECPKCKRTMKPFRFDYHETFVQIDRCDSCVSYWFDPGALKLMQEALTETKDHLPNSNLHPIYIYSAYEEYEKAFRIKWIRRLRIFGSVLLAINILVYFKTKAFAHEYSGFMNMNMKRAPDPAASAMIAAFSLVLFTLSPRRCGLAILIALYFMLQSLLVWVARY